MKTMKEFLEEALILSNKKRPNYNTVFIVAGGTGSGKSLVRNKLLGISGKVIDSDEIKKFMLFSDVIRTKAREIGFDITKMDMLSPEDTNKLYLVMKSLGTFNKFTETLFKSISGCVSGCRPNLIFDTTLKSSVMLVNIKKTVENLGYNLKNVHVVWVLSDREKSLQRNSVRQDRVVLADVADAIHYDVSASMHTILQSPMFSDLGLSTIVMNDTNNSIELSSGVVERVRKFDHIMGTKFSQEELDLIRSVVPNPEIWK